MIEEYSTVHWLHAIREETFTPQTKHVPAALFLNSCCQKNAIAFSHSSLSKSFKELAMFLMALLGAVAVLSVVIVWHLLLITICYFYSGFRTLFLFFKAVAEKLNGCCYKCRCGKFSSPSCAIVASAVMSMPLSGTLLANERALITSHAKSLLVKSGPFSGFTVV